MLNSVTEQMLSIQGIIQPQITVYLPITGFNEQAIGKVSQVHEAYRIYGTDDTGNQKDYIAGVNTASQQGDCQIPLRDDNGNLYAGSGSNKKLVNESELGNKLKDNVPVSRYVDAPDNDDSITITKDGNNITLALASRYKQYLDSVLYQAPNISNFTLEVKAITSDNVETSYNASNMIAIEYGCNIKQLTITADIDNVENVTGRVISLSRKIGDTDTVLPNITASSSISEEYNSTDEDWNDFKPGNKNTTTYTLSGTNTNGQSFDDTAKITVYTPSFIVFSTDDDLTTVEMTNPGRVNATSLAGTQKLNATTSYGYYYFITTDTITSIVNQADNLSVDFTQLPDMTLSLNGEPISYKRYRTGELLPIENDVRVKIS